MLAFSEGYPLDSFFFCFRKRGGGGGWQGYGFWYSYEVGTFALSCGRLVVARGLPITVPSQE